MFVYTIEFVSLKMADGQIKFKGQKMAPGCRHFTSEWDSHHYYYRALAREGDYEMMPVCACVRVCVR